MAQGNQRFRLACKHCDTDAFDSVAELPTDWEDIQPVSNDGSDSQWWSHPGTCPSCRAMNTACDLISQERAEELLKLLNWKHGGCLTLRERPKIAELSAEEDEAVRAVWDTIPDGSSSWMTAFYRILNTQRESQCNEP